MEHKNLDLSKTRKNKPFHKIFFHAKFDLVLVWIPNIGSNSASGDLVSFHLTLTRERIKILTTAGDPDLAKELNFFLVLGMTCISLTERKKKRAGLCRD